MGRDVASGDLVLVGGESSQDFVLLLFRHLEEIQRPSEFRRDLIEFCGRDLEDPARNFTDPPRVSNPEPEPDKVGSPAAFAVPVAIVPPASAHAAPAMHPATAMARQMVGGLETFIPFLSVYLPFLIQFP